MQVSILWPPRASAGVSCTDSSETVYVSVNARTEQRVSLRCACCLNDILCLWCSTLRKLTKLPARSTPEQLLHTLRKLRTAEDRLMLLGALPA